MKRKLLSLLGMATRAGKLCPGFSRCSSAIKSAKANLVIVCRDMSDKTVKEVRFLCDKFNTPVTESDITIEELSVAIGFKAGVCAVCDEGFVRSIASLINSIGKDD